MRLTLLFSALILSCLPAVTEAQVRKKTKEKPAHTVSFVAVGSRSDSYWTGSGAATRVHAHDPGAAPPSKIYIKSSASGRKSQDSSRKEKKTETRLALNVPSPRIKISSSNSVVSAKMSTDSTALSPLADLKLPQKYGSHTVFLARIPKAKDWVKPQLLLASDSTSIFPLGSSRIVNLSDRPILVQNGSKKLGVIAPKKAIILKKSLSLTKPLTLTLWYQEGGRKVPAFRRTLKYPTNQRVNIACTYVPKRSRPILAQIFTTPAI